MTTTKTKITIELDNRNIEYIEEFSKNIGRDFSQLVDGCIDFLQFSISKNNEIMRTEKRKEPTDEMKAIMCFLHGIEVHLHALWTKDEIEKNFDLLKKEKNKNG